MVLEVDGGGGTRPAPKVVRGSAQGCNSILPVCLQCRIQALDTIECVPSLLKLERKLTRTRLLALPLEYCSAGPADRSSSSLCERLRFDRGKSGPWHSEGS